jgi:hypothetical protein
VDVPDPDHIPIGHQIRQGRRQRRPGLAAARCPRLTAAANAIADRRDPKDNELPREYFRFPPF